MGKKKPKPRTEEEMRKAKQEYEDKIFTEPDRSQITETVGEHGAKVESFFVFCRLRWISVRIEYPSKVLPAGETELAFAFNYRLYTRTYPRVISPYEARSLAIEFMTSITHEEEIVGIDLDTLREALGRLSLQTAKLLAEKGDHDATCYPDEVYVSLVPVGDLKAKLWRRQNDYLGLGIDVVFATDKKNVVLQSIRVDKERYEIS